MLSPLAGASQSRLKLDSTTEDIYYLGINPIAPFTCIRSEATSQYLPYLSNQETGVALFVGKIWNKNYNVETRLSFGSPNSSYNLFQVHSGFNYLLNTKKNFRPYAGLFLKLYSLHEMDTKTDYVSAIGYICIGNRFIWNRYFLDLRLNQNIYAVSWSNLPDTKATSGFHPSIYKWESSYIPYAGINIGYMFR
jgi:hypothetical protein